ncbi:MAG: Holliday junction DNA helicase RuvA [Planctomycetota bacterium]|nr:MAG: Holliday junction DNA helicase RuvA [Planctomycetota bacterium]
MITRICGTLQSLGEDAAIVRIGAFDYEVLVPKAVARQLQAHLQREVALETIEYIEGNPQKGRLTPRLVGFMNAAEREFFELFCSVDGVGVRKALRAMVRPVQEIAEAIAERDVKALATLPGIGPAVAERVVAKLRRKMAKFALLVAREVPAETATERSILDDAFDALVALGHSPADARQKINQAVGAGKTFKSVEDLLLEIYHQQHRPH